jgi:hypothetical protein
MRQVREVIKPVLSPFAACQWVLSPEQNGV